MHRRTFLLTVAAAATGCTMGPQRRPNPFDAQGGGNSIKIEVVNRNFNQATLVALSPVRRRIGIVGGNSSQSFSFAWSSGDQLRIHIDLLAGGSTTTNSIAIGPGETAYLVVENPVNRSLLRR